ncbi:MAG TPA: ATP synthase F0 subunit B [Acidimicrobiales bacterium]
MSDFDDSELDIDLTPPPVGSQYHPADTEEVLLQLRDVIEAARPVPLSASSMIAKEEVLDLVDEALSHLPEELRAARWLLKEREEFLARTRHEADEIIDQARVRAERMVQRTEVVKAAEARAYEIVDTAQAESRRLRHEVEDFCDQKLASFEIVLERTQKLVAAGRSKLQGTHLLAEAAAAAAAEGIVEEDFDEDDPMTSGHPSSGRVAVAEVAYEAYDGDYGTDELGDDDHDDYDDEGYEAPRAEERSGQGRLKVVDDRFADLPPPPGERTGSTGDAASTFFDQDLA